MPLRSPELYGWPPDANLSSAAGYGGRAEDPDDKVVVVVFVRRLKLRIGFGAQLSANRRTIAGSGLKR